MDSAASLDSHLESLTHPDRCPVDGSPPNSLNYTRTDTKIIDGVHVRRYVNEFWTSRQRQASSIHELSYRACFKPQLPGFFIDLLSKAGNVVYDPFSGRGTTVIEAGVRGRNIISNDVNPLSDVLTRPRFDPPQISEIERRLLSVPVDETLDPETDLSMFFHERTLLEILSLRKYLHEKRAARQDDKVDRWIAMVATNRLTGHSSGFFSVYTLPPNQAVSPSRQRKININRKQTPEYRNVIELVIRKSVSLLRSVTAEQLINLRKAGKSAMFLNADARQTGEIGTDSVQLVVTSPPFLDVVQYTNDNWMRLWFNSINVQDTTTMITMTRKVAEWSMFIKAVFLELFRVVKSNGWVAFEVGEVKNRTVHLDEHVVPIGSGVGFECQGILINSQKFSKTSNIWGVRNMESGTNTNRIVIFRKP